MARGPAPLVSAPAPGNSVSKSEDDTAVWSLRHIQILWSWAARPPKPKPSYPPVSSIPKTSAARLAEPDASPSPFPSEPILAKTIQQNAPSKPKTVLYLAYGSNMCAETFLGMRRIRPLSAVNVSVPSLDLIFDLPGIPYREPCFANTALRKVPKPPKLPPVPPVPPQIPDHPPIKPPTAQDDSAIYSGQRPPVWNKGLYGIVYEVTTEDFARIFATEGGGASYHDILVPCIPLPASISVPEKPAIPIPPTPFLAHTLYAPRLPDHPGDDDNNTAIPTTPITTTTANDDEDTPSSWWRTFLKKLLLPRRRPSSTYAQPSARYLNLLRAGAREHELPADYQSYLDALQPYTITTRRQKLGQIMFLGFWAPLVILVMIGGRVFANEKGLSPPWMVAVSTAVINMVWMSYDLVGKRVFGDGERTIEEGGEEEGERRQGVRQGGRRRGSFASGLRGKEEVVDEEKTGLMEDYDD